MKNATLDPLFVEADRLFAESRQKARSELGKLLGATPGKREKPLRRVEEFWPYLLVRSRTGDNGTRPLARGSKWHMSPDIWLVNGPPPTAPDLPPSPLQVIPGATSWPDVPYLAVEGADHTVYAHVWNLGRAPAGQARVEFFWFLGGGGLFAPPEANFIGMAHVDLPPRSAFDCHRLVKCPVAWQPRLPASPAPSTGAAAAEAVHLVVRVSSFDDPPSGWDPAHDRHLAAHAALVSRRQPA